MLPTYHQLKPIWCIAFSILISCATQAAGPRSLVPKHPASLLDTSGKPIELPQAKLTVYCFLGTQCPLAKLYGPRLQKLADQFAQDGVTFVGINSNLQDSPDEIDQYVDAHAIEFPMAWDADQSIADLLGATRTPEVIALDSSGRVRYRGRIDDQYQPGVIRAAPETNDLRDAIKQFLAGNEVLVPVTQGVGCLITRAPKKTIATAKATYTFNRDVAPILNKHCVECHREGEIAPFTLGDYDEVIGWADMMLEVIDQRRMPPWHADPNVGQFEGARNLPPKSRDILAQWIEEGMVEGDAKDLPEPPSFAAGWHLSTEPDLQIAMRDRPFAVPADGVVEYQYFVVDPGWETDRWVRSAQVIPGDASVVHHTIVFVRPPDGGDFSGSGWLGAYVPGQRTIQLPPGHARRIPAGSRLVFQQHYTPNGTPTEDLTRVGIWLIDQPSVTHQVTTHIAINHEFEIPPGDSDFRVNLSSSSFPRSGRLLGITPHMHFRGKSFQLFANKIDDEKHSGHGLPKHDGSKPSDSKPEEWLRVPAYDFNWQHWYAFSKPKDLHDIDSLTMTVEFDNSSNNPFNPDPNEYVSWGDQTWEEMAAAFFDVATPLGKPLFRKRRVLKKDEKQLAILRAKAETMADRFFKQMDSNQDGAVVREETAETFRRFGFRNLDHDGNGRITRDEVMEESADQIMREASERD